VYDNLKKRKFGLLIFISYYFIGFLGIFLGLKLPVNQSIHEAIPFASINECTQKTLSQLVSNTDYERVQSYLLKSEKKPVKIFSFPSDVIFYNMFDARPPFFLTSYSSAGYYGESKELAFIKNNTDFIIYNLSIPADQDGVPNYVRSPMQMKYIFTSFYPEKKIGNFLILKRSTQDIFGDKSNSVDKSLTNYLLNPNLQAIPKSEGKKVGYFNKVSFSSPMTINDMLTKNSEDYFQMYILLKQKNIAPNPDLQTLDIETKTGLRTTVYFKQCGKNSFCVFDLSRIPLFYKNRLISSIKVKSDIYDIALVKLKDKKDLW